MNQDDQGHNGDIKTNGEARKLELFEYFAQGNTHIFIFDMLNQVDSWCLALS